MAIHGNTSQVRSPGFLIVHFLTSAVSITPGANALTVTPDVARSIPVIRIITALLAPEAVLLVPPRMPAIEVMAIILP